MNGTYRDRNAVQHGKQAKCQNKDGDGGSGSAGPSVLAGSLHPARFFDRHSCRWAGGNTAGPNRARP